MKFFTYSNDNDNYTKAVSLENVQLVEITEMAGKSAIRFGVALRYKDGSTESLLWLGKEEAAKVFKEIVKLLNE